MLECESVLRKVSWDFEKYWKGKDKLRPPFAAPLIHQLESLT